MLSDHVIKSRQAMLIVTPLIFSQPATFLNRYICIVVVFVVAIVIVDLFLFSSSPSYSSSSCPHARLAKPSPIPGLS